MAKQSARRPSSGPRAPRTRDGSTASVDDDLRHQQRAQRMVLVMAIAVLTVFVIGMVVVFVRSTDDAETSGSEAGTRASSTTVSTVLDPGGPPPTAAGPPVPVPSVAPGEVMEAPTPCPSLDGSSPRITSFAEAPPMCIDPTLSYRMTIQTSVGELQFFLNANQGAAAVNNFIVLAAYHYYDGVPLSRIDPEVDFQVAPSFDDPPGVESPGYPIPSNAAPSVVSVGTIALLGSADDGQSAAGFKVAIGQDAVGWSEDSPIIGLLLDGLPTMQAIRRAGTPKSGAPTQVITIDRVSTTPGPPLGDPPAGATP